MNLYQRAEVQRAEVPAEKVRTNFEHRVGFEPLKSWPARPHPEQKRLDEYRSINSLYQESK